MQKIKSAFDISFFDFKDSLQSLLVCDESSTYVIYLKSFIGTTYEGESIFGTKDRRRINNV